jgi:nucleoside-diphosphate-sugar epimerase
LIDSNVEANLRAARTSLPSATVMNVATGCRLSLNELVRILNEIFGAQIEPIYELRVGDLKHAYADITVSEELLDNYNVTPFRDGASKHCRMAF